MKKIRQLSQKEIQVIAAGEVVENTASIVKELVENAIDAKAKKISVSFMNSGLDEIMVEDDGEGISSEDLALVFLQHATSKLSSIESLYLDKERAFGFRGEALASIGGVAEVSIVSKIEEASSGYAITASHGNISKVRKAAANKGTRIIVQELFENLGARKKYILAKKKQEKDILYVLRGLVLAEPKITFVIKKDKDKSFLVYSEAENFLGRAYSLIFQDRDKYLSFEHSDEYAKIEGLISSSEYGYYDKSRIFILINGRLIKQSVLFQSCIRPYYAENFTKRYPELYVSITVPPDQVDVNVHPRKEEVLFLYQKKIESILFSLITKTIEQKTKKNFSTCLASSTTLPESAVNSGDSFAQKNKSFLSGEQKSIQKNKNVDFSDHYPMRQGEQKVYKEAIYQASESVRHQQGVIAQKNTFDSKDAFSYTTKNPEAACLASQEVLLEKPYEGKFIGVLDKTYLMFLNKRSILFVDQHAIHEKILYEEFIDTCGNSSEQKQSLLFPEKIILEEESIASFFESESTFFDSIGLHYLISGKILYVQEIFSLYKKIDLKEALLKFYAHCLEKNGGGSEYEKKTLFLDSAAAMYGCKNAVKAGDILSEEEIQLLSQKSLRLRNATFCPHGRPVYYEIFASDLASFFKRT
jgi:DNA mismatch repair protein MutL